jgi:hypothetical protein
MWTIQEYTAGANLFGTWWAELGVDCTGQADGTPCDDGQGCAGTESCSAGACSCSSGGHMDAGTDACVPLTACPHPDDCGVMGDGCGGVLTCGTGTCLAPQTCGGGGVPNVCGGGGGHDGGVEDGGGDDGGSDDGGVQESGVDGATADGSADACTPLAMCPAPDNCGRVYDHCGGTVSCGTCTGTDRCENNVCVPLPLPDAGTDSGYAGFDAGGYDAGTVADAAAGGDSSDGGGSTGDSGGCGCKTAGSRGGNTPLSVAALAALALVGVRRSRKTRRAAS